jgi:hypothetical protein
VASFSPESSLFSQSKFPVVVKGKEKVDLKILTRVLTELRFMSQPSLVPSFSKGKPRSSSRA